MHVESLLFKLLICHIGKLQMRKRERDTWRLLLVCLSSSVPKIIDRVWFGTVSCSIKNIWASLFRDVLMPEISMKVFSMKIKCFVLHAFFKETSLSSFFLIFSSFYFVIFALFPAFATEQWLMYVASLTFIALVQKMQNKQNTKKKQTNCGLTNSCKNNWWMKGIDGKSDRLLLSLMAVQTYNFLLGYKSTVAILL